MEVLNEENEDRQHYSEELDCYFLSEYIIDKNQQTPSKIDFCGN